MLFTIITLSILTASIILAYAYSYVMLHTTWLQNRKIQPLRYKNNVFKEHLPLIALNLGILYIFTFVGLYFGHPIFKIETPIWWVFFVQIFLMLVMDDTFFYFFHRYMHENNYLFKTIHKIHHKASPPFALDFMYVHPLEWMLGTIGVVIGLGCTFFIFGEINAYSFWIFAFHRNFHEVDIHSGIRSYIAQYIPFFGTAEHHDYHHSRLNGNYASSLTFWDKVFKTEIVRKKD